MNVKMYGIKNCDTIKKARLFLTNKAISYQFIDYRQDGLSRELLTEFAQQLGWQALLNTRGTTYRALPESDKVGLDETKAIELMLAQPALIKRPLLDVNGNFYLGFNPEHYAQYTEGLV